MFQCSRPKAKLCRTASDKLLHSGKAGKPPSGLAVGKKSPGKESGFVVENGEWNQRPIGTAWTAAAARDDGQANDNNGSYVEQSFSQSK